MRESQVREMVKELKEFGIKIYDYDPLLTKEEIESFGVEALDFSFSTNLFFQTLGKFNQNASQKEKLYQKKELRFSFSTGFLL